MSTPITKSLRKDMVVTLRDVNGITNSDTGNTIKLARGYYIDLLATSFKVGCKTIINESNVPLKEFNDTVNYSDRKEENVIGGFEKDAITISGVLDQLNPNIGGRSIGGVQCIPISLFLLSQLCKFHSTLYLKDYHGSDKTLQTWINSQIYNVDYTGDYGTSTSVGVGTLTDTSKSWTTNEWVGKYVKDSSNNVYEITANNSTSLTLDNSEFSSSATPTSGSYQIGSKIYGPDGIPVTVASVSPDRRDSNDSDTGHVWGYSMILREDKQ